MSESGNPYRAPDSPTTLAPRRLSDQAYNIWISCYVLALLWSNGVVLILCISTDLFESTWLQSFWYSTTLLACFLIVWMRVSRRWKVALVIAAVAFVIFELFAIFIVALIIAPPNDF